MPPSPSIQIESNQTHPQLALWSQRKEGMQSKLGSGMWCLQQATPEVDRNSIRLKLLTRAAVRNCSRGFYPPRPRPQLTPDPPTDEPTPL
jgi:beta-galactosidase/beta-glucuronidase